MNYGECQFCGANNVKSPKTGKIFCSEKCWLKNQPQEKPQYQKPQPKPEPDWNKINEDKELAKEWVSAKICATDVLVAFIEKGQITSLEEFKGQFKGLVKFIYETGSDETTQQQNQNGQYGI